MAAKAPVTGGRRAPAPPLPCRATFALLLGVAALATAAPPATAGEAVEILRIYDKLGDAKVELAPARDGAIICYAYDKQGEVLGHQPGYVEMRSIRFYGIPFDAVGDATCERLD